MAMIITIEVKNMRYLFLAVIVLTPQLLAVNLIMIGRCLTLHLPHGSRSTAIHFLIIHFVTRLDISGWLNNQIRRRLRYAYPYLLCGCWLYYFVLNNPILNISDKYTPLTMIKSIEAIKGSVLNRNKTGSNDAI